MARNNARLSVLSRELSDESPNRELDDELMKLAMEDLRERTLASLDGRFHKLVYIAGLLDGEHYRHDGLASIYNDSIADHVLRESHVEVWTQWMECKMDEQSEDLDKYLRHCRARVLLEWQEKDFGRLTPPSMPSFLEHHFRTNLQMLIERRVRAIR
jgi:hypothetical protein